MLTAFTVENYRSFADRTRIELRPLTLLFGYNNSGKSALVRALPLIADSMKPDVTGPLNLASEAVRKTTFDGLATKGSARFIHLGIELSGGTLVAYFVAQPPGSLFQELASATISHPGLGTMTFQMEPRRGSRPEYSVLWNGEPTGMRWTQPFAGLALAPLREVSMPDGNAEADRARASCDHLMGSFSQATQLLRAYGLFWLGSLRKYPEPYLEYRPGGAPPRLLPDGSNAPEILALDKLSQGPLLSDVSAWYERTFQRRLDVVLREDGRFSLMLEPTKIGESMRVPVADTGEGMAQVLPVLLAAAMARRGEVQHGDPSLLAFEQPELHLHPDAHAPLAEHLCALAAKDDPPCTLIETHSENFLLGVQLQIVTGLLRPDRVLVYWVQQDHDGTSRVTRVTFDGEGRPHGGWPPGVFSTDMELTRRLIDERRARKAPPAA
jgi:hypothetical protein